MKRSKSSDGHGHKSNGAGDEIRAVKALRRMVQLRDIDSRMLMDKYDISLPQLIILRALEANGRMTATEISGKARLSPSTIIGIFDRLEKKKFVSRERDTRDRRLVYVTLTHTGKAVVNSINNEKIGGIESFIHLLPKTEQKRLAEIWEKLCSLMEESHADRQDAKTGK